MEKFKWGILGPGAISHKFVKDIQTIDEAEVIAVGSRSDKRSKNFAREYGIPRAYGNYEELAKDPDIDAVYVAIPHPFHMENSILCMEEGKAVLCEKPLAMNLWQVKKMIESSKKNGVFLMEAMWSRFLPVYGKIREWIKEGKIGHINMLKADFGYRREWNSKARQINLGLGGGALLDLGIYPIDLTFMVFRAKPSEICSLSYIGREGTDRQSTILLGYDKGKTAVVSNSTITRMPNDAWILGDRGNIYIKKFWAATSAILNEYCGKETVYNAGPFKGTGLEYEIREVINCLKEGKLESFIRPLSDSLSVIETIDKIRNQWGLRYPVKGEFE